MIRFVTRHANHVILFVVLVLLVTYAVTRPKLTITQAIEIIKTKYRIDDTGYRYKVDKVIRFGFPWFEPYYQIKVYDGGNNLIYNILMESRTGQIWRFSFGG